jgi:uncharacterized protein YjbJ (UPF0337 family)
VKSALILILEKAQLGSAYRRNEEESPMKPSTKDQVEGTLHEIKGNVKEKAEQVTNNPKVATKGQAEKLAGKVQMKVGQVEKVFGK